MSPHDIFESGGEVIARSPPVPNISQLKNRCASEFCQVKILMRDRISPGIQLGQSVLPAFAALIQAQNFIPKREPKPIEVFSNITRIGVSCFELSMEQKHIAK